VRCQAARTDRARPGRNPIIDQACGEPRDGHALDDNGDEFEGATLLHADLHAGNLLIDGTRCQIVDWSMACRGAPWVDVAFLLPRLIDAGHTPAEAEDVAARVPAWGAAPGDAVTALAATRALFATRMADVGPAHLQAKRLRTAAACRAWVEYRTS